MTWVLLSWAVCASLFAIAAFRDQARAHERAIRLLRDNLRLRRRLEESRAGLN